jgi:hypothetical protein
VGNGSEPVDLHSIDLKVWGAEAHQQTLKAIVDRIGKFRLYRFALKIEREGLEHTYYPVKPAPVPDNFMVPLGDCVHNLRSALDHLACHLVRVSHGTSPDKASFPVWSREFRTNPCTGAEEPCLQLDVTPAIRERIDAIQPYKGTDTGERLRLLHKLDIVDKHRGQLLTAAAAGGGRRTYTLANWPQASGRSVGKLTWISSDPLQDGKPCVRFSHDTPQFEIDPYLEVFVKILFSDGSPGAGQGVIAVVDDLVRLVRDELIPTFTPFLGYGPTRPWVRTYTTI